MDRKQFSSFALAQLTVANAIYEHLDCPLFLFCPTGLLKIDAIYFHLQNTANHVLYPTLMSPNIFHCLVLNFIPIFTFFGQVFSNKSFRIQKFIFYRPSCSFSPSHHRTSSTGIQRAQEKTNDMGQFARQWLRPKTSFHGPFPWSLGGHQKSYFGSFAESKL